MNINIGHVIQIKMATPQETGYQCIFVNNVKDYECPLCLHVTRDPNLTSCCGQHFCHHCIQIIISSNKPCPFCKENGFTTFLDKKQKRRVFDLKVYCKKAWCDWKGSLGELEQHLSEKCLYVSVNCSYNCGEAIFRLRLKQHQSNECPKRPHSCKHCQLEGTYQDIKENHVPVCSKYPVSCPNECEVSSLQRDQLEQHLRECPLTIVECELREVGCEEKLQRKDLDRHMEEGARKHLTLSTSYFIKNLRRQDKEIAKLQQENEKLRHNCSLLDQQNKEQKIKLTMLADQVKLLSHKVVNLTVNYNEFMASCNNRWEDSEELKTLSGCTLKIVLYKRKELDFHRDLFRNERLQKNSPIQLDIELTHIKSAVDDSLRWPKNFSMKVKLLNQVGNHHHYEVSGDNLQVRWSHYNDELSIPSKVIKDPPPGVSFIVNGHIQMEITVIEK